MQFAPVEVGGDIVFLLNEEEGLANLISSGSSSLDRKRLIDSENECVHGATTVVIEKVDSVSYTTEQN